MGYRFQAVTFGWSTMEAIASFIIFFFFNFIFLFFFMVLPGMPVNEEILNST